jgi:hypothetical protein
LSGWSPWDSAEMVLSFSASKTGRRPVALGPRWGGSAAQRVGSR